MLVVFGYLESYVNDNCINSNIYIFKQLTGLMKKLIKTAGLQMKIFQKTNNKDNEDGKGLWIYQMTKCSQSVRAY